MTKEARKLLQNQLEQLIAESAAKLRPLLQVEQVELADEKLEKFHKENPGRDEVVKAVFKRFRHPEATEKPTLKTQRQCDHTKGQGLFLRALGYFVPKSKYEDYAIGYHIFPDGRQKIWCLICGEPWTPGKPGWEQAVEMLGHSTNTRTTSEHLIPVREAPAVQAVYQEILK